MKTTNRQLSFARTRKSYEMVRLAQRFAPSMAHEPLHVLKKHYVGWILKAIYDECLLVSLPSFPDFSTLKRLDADRSEKWGANGIYFDVAVV